MSKIKSLAGDTILYGMGTIVPRVINFFLIVPHTAVFDPSEYGQVTLVYALASFLNVLFTFGLETAYFRFSTRQGADPQKTFNQAQTAVTLLTVVLTGVFLLLAQPLATALGIAGHPEYLTLIIWTVAIDAFVALPFARLRLERKARRFALAKILNVAVILALNFYFLQVAYDPAVGVRYVFIINVVANALLIFFFLPLLLRWRPALDWGVLKEMGVYAFPIMLTGLAGMTNETFSRLMLERWLPDDFYGDASKSHALGVFGAGYKLSVFMAVAIQAFRFAAEPFFFSNASDKRSKELFANVNHYFIITCCILLLAVGLNLDVLKYLLRNPAYWEGLKIVPVLLAAYLFLGIYYNLTVWFKLTDRTYYGTLITLLGALVTVALNYVLIPVAGYLGSSWAAFACYFSMAAACYLLGQRHYPIPYRVGAGLAYVAVSVALVVGGNMLPAGNPWISFFLHNGILLAFIGVVYGLERRRLHATLGG